MALHAATTGHYTATFGAADLGKTEEGWFMEINHKGEMVKFEEFSENIVDMIIQGADVYVETVLKEWNSAALKNALWMHSNTFGDIECTGANFAVLGAYAAPLVLTASACSPAATDGPATITFHNAIMAPEVSSRINFNNDLRVVPIRFNVFLSEVSTQTKYFTVT